MAVKMEKITITIPLDKAMARPDNTPNMSQDQAPAERGRIKRNKEKTETRPVNSFLFLKKLSKKNSLNSF